MSKKVKFKKLRLWLAYPMFFVYPFVAHMTDFSFFAGSFLMLLGLVVRFWASGYISKSRSLAVCGPYAYMRNPLYLGNFILGFGIIVIANNFWLSMYYFIAFTILYIGTIKEEQDGLVKKFGAPYETYMAKVPMFFPSLRPWRHAERKSFSLQQSFKNGEFIRIYGFLLLIVFFYLWKILFVDKEGLLPGHIVAVVVFVVFLFLLWFNIYIRRKSERVS
ncbi:MAG: isoprenylcysteine carboxylmethyltransferase family protein [Candidatus Omnitrophota bacterium]